MTYANLVEGLEQPKEVFYGRMAPWEVDEVQGLVDYIAGQVAGRVDGPILIAGVGGILRRDDPRQAEDIDLAIAGFHYAEVGQHNFGHVRSFTSDLANIGSALVQYLAEGEITCTPLYGGSGPFAKWNLERSFPTQRATGTLTDEIASFGLYNSKGFKLQVNRSRPIDFQFAFNRTPEVWRLNQEVMRKWGESQAGLPYAVLFER